MPAIFSDHMVLQQAAAVPVWGKAAAGEAVTVSVAGQSGQTVAAGDGRWRVTLDLANAGAGPHTLTVSGNNTVTISDVLVGQVWLAAGQSNMEFTLKNVIGGAEAIAAPAEPLLRQYFVTRNGWFKPPAEEGAGRWLVASPETLPQFSGVGYFFAKALRERVGGPVAVILSAFGGTQVEAWTSAEAVRSDPEVGPAAELYWKQYAEFPAAREQFEKDCAAWFAALTPPVSPKSPASSTPETIRLPAKINLTGEMVLEKKFDAPAGLGAEQRFLDVPSVYGELRRVALNGAELQRQNPAYAGVKPIGKREPQRFIIPAGALADGANTLTLTWFLPLPDTAVPPPRISSQPVLNGDWTLTLTRPLTVTTPAPQPPVEPEGMQASALFNAMINPLIPYRIAGAIWYQGESNGGRAWQYRRLFPLMINDWRAHWGQGDFPFYFVQLANFTEKRFLAGEQDEWAELREAQALTLSLPNTGMATAIDVGEARDLHPRDKRTIGDRLAAIALANVYGQKVSFSGPTVSGVNIEGGRVRVQFTHTDGGLVARPVPPVHVVKSLSNETAPLTRNSPDSELEGFAIAGADRRWHWADAKVDGDSVLIWSAQVPQPIAVRYLWGYNPTGNLYNAAGFPAPPFRTDDFPALTVDRKY
jgi:sialate O-acetylesterase